MRGALRELWVLERINIGPGTVVVSYQSAQADAMWAICAGLTKLGFKVFNGNQIEGGEAWDEVYFDEYLEPARVGLPMLSDAFFGSKACLEELKMMHKMNAPQTLHMGAATITSNQHTVNIRHNEMLNGDSSKRRPNTTTNGSV